jgi:hypothetical protein
LSYDLLLEGSDIDPFRLLMKTEANVESGDDGKSWLFQDDSTGVYFTMRVDEVIDDELIAAGASTAPYISCEVNFLRPSFFMDEALPAILRYARETGLTVRDPQREDVPLTPDVVDQTAIRTQWLAMTAKWARESSEALPFLDPTSSAAMFQHNLTRDALMNDPVRNKAGLFIPLLLPILRSAEPRRVRTGIVIGPNIALLIPPCDVVVLASRKSVLGVDVGRFLKRLVTRAAFNEHLAQYLEFPTNPTSALLAPNISRAWSALKGLPAEPESSFDKLDFDRFVDVE